MIEPVDIGFVIARFFLLRRPCLAFIQQQSWNPSAPVLFMRAKIFCHAADHVRNFSHRPLFINISHILFQYDSVYIWHNAQGPVKSILLEAFCIKSILGCQKLICIQSP